LAYTADPLLLLLLLRMLYHDRDHQQRYQDYIRAATTATSSKYNRAFNLIAGFRHSA